jgi:hypothetical protein
VYDKADELQIPSVSAVKSIMVTEGSRHIAAAVQNPDDKYVVFPQAVENNMGKFWKALQATPDFITIFPHAWVGRQFQENSL